MKNLISAFINICLVCVCILSLWFLLQKPPRPAVWQGPASSHQTTLSVLFHKDQNFNYFIEKTPSQTIQVHPIQQAKRDHSDYKIEHFLLADLDPQASYTFTIKNQESKIVDQRIFQTLDLNSSSLVFAAASCMDDRWNKKEQDQMWTELFSKNPQMIFLIGDNVYADKYMKGHYKNEDEDKYIQALSMEHFWSRYVETIQTLALYKQKHLTPILAVWDDHDYGQNNGDRHFKHRRPMQKLFRDFFYTHFEEKHFFQGPGLSFALKTKSQNFFFMDNRSFQSQDSAGSLWGNQQEKWLLEGLNQTHSPGWIINGTQMIGRHHPFEAFETKFPNNFKEMMEKIKTAKSPVIFLSGDRHIGELSDFSRALSWPYPTYEITTSPIHAKIYPKSKDLNFNKNPHILHHIANKLNYAMIESKGEKKKLSVQIKIYGKNNTLLLSRKLTVSNN